MSEYHSPPAGYVEQLQNLPTFLSVAQARSVTGAAKQIFKAPSAITRSILELERSLGSPLFERRPRGMLLNAVGQVVLQRTERIMAEIVEGVDHFLEGTMQGRSISPSAIRSVLFNGRKLQLLVLLTELRHISAAASHLGLTQAGASMALSRIEDSLGQPLFQRRLEGMVATEATERLVMYARRVFAELRHLSSDLAALTGTIFGSVVIGTTPLGRTPPFTSAIDKVTGRYPGIKITTIENGYEQLIRDLRSGEIDLVLGVLRPPHLNLGLETEALFMDRLAALVRTGHRLAGKRDLKLDDLLGERLILPRPNSLARPVLESGFHELGVELPEPTVETGDLAIIRQLLTSSDMLAFTSPFQLMTEIHNRTVTELPLRLSGTMRAVGLIRRSGAMLSPAAHEALRAIQTHMREGAVLPGDLPPCEAQAATAQAENQT